MHITFEGIHNEQEMKENLIAVLNLFKERYQVRHFREIHLNVTLVDEEGGDIELVDDITNQAFRHLKVCTAEHAEKSEPDSPTIGLRLVVDNTAVKG